MNPTISKVAVDAAIVTVFALLILLSVFLLLGETWPTIIAFISSLAISIGARLAFESGHKKTASPVTEGTSAEIVNNTLE